jgi:hypothetical protein
MRMTVAGLAAIVAALPVAAAAADKLTGKEIDGIFGSGLAFTAAVVGGPSYKMVLRPDGTAERTVAGSDRHETGRWRLADQGVCARWGDAPETCFGVERVNPVAYDVVDTGGAVVAYWRPTL